MPISSDVKETLLELLSASMSSSIHQIAAEHLNNPTDRESLELVTQAWHQALLSFHNAALLDSSTGVAPGVIASGAQLDDADLLYKFALASRAGQAADFYALLICNRNRVSIGLPPMSQTAAEAYRAARRAEWATRLEAELRKQRDELGVQRLSFEQRDKVINDFWSLIWDELLLRDIDKNSNLPQKQS